MDEWMDEWMNEWMDGWTNVTIWVNLFQLYHTIWNSN